MGGGGALLGNPNLPVPSDFCRRPHFFYEDQQPQRREIWLASQHAVETIDDPRNLDFEIAEHRSSSTGRGQVVVVTVS